MKPRPQKSSITFGPSDMSEVQNLGLYDETCPTDMSVRRWLNQLWRSVLERPALASVICLTSVALITRLSCLDMLPGTTWDEVHFGGFANKYINRTFYHDVHPPLGKIMIAGAAFLTGYRAQFNFSEGNFYDETVRYQLIRSELAIVGALIIPVSFLTVYQLTQSVTAANLASLAVLCDTFVHKINSLILLDPLLNFIICLCVFSTFRFHHFRDRAFSVCWWRWLMFTGVCLGVVLSIKYIGLFTILFVGLHTAWQLYSIACDRQRPFWYVIPHTLARILGLILLPLFIYLAGFVLHLSILTETTLNSGGWLHSRFYASLNNTEYQNKTFPKYVNYGANITIQSSSLHSGYLESWFDLYPSELTSACQVVSTLTLRDPDATEWMLRRVDLDTGTIIDTSNPMEPPQIVRNGDWVMMTHLGTERSLRSHNRRAPFTKKLFQVCCYGDNRTGGPFETWQIVVPGEQLGEPLQLFAHDFKLLHYKMRCYLSASDVTLPKEWANEGSKEVACSRNPNYPSLLWHVSWIDTSKAVGRTVLQEHTMGLWERIVRLHKLMFDLNAGLVKKEKSEVTFDVSDSRPWMWPLAYQMQMLGGYGDERISQEITSFSVAAWNPFIAYSNVVALFALVALFLYHWFKIFREADEPSEVVGRREMVVNAGLWLLLCWAGHYLPFFFMNRVLYIHHYCPAFIFSCMITGVILDHTFFVTANWINSKVQKVTLKKSHLALFPGLMFIISYLCFYPLATYINGTPFSETSLNYFLDKFYYGQAWLEFGYMSDAQRSKFVRTYKMEPVEFMESPFMNLTLYYETDLNTTRPNSVEEGEINPIAASKFSAWMESQASNTADATIIRTGESEEDKINNFNLDGNSKINNDFYGEGNKMAERSKNNSNSHQDNK